MQDLKNTRLLIYKCLRYAASRINSLHAEIVCTIAIINVEINVICPRVKVSSVA